MGLVAQASQLLQRRRQKDSKSKASLGNLVKPCLKMKRRLGILPETYIREALGSFFSTTTTNPNCFCHGCSLWPLLSQSDGSVVVGPEVK